MNRIFLWKTVLRARIKYRLGSRTVWPSRAFVNETSCNLIKVAENVEKARVSTSPIVSLESNIYTHGWPYPDNIQLAFHLQDLIRSHGATPATIGVINGVATVGLSDREIVTLCTAASNPTTLKVSRRDLPFILGMGITGNKLHGGTTVSGTMFLSRWAGISIVGAGGIGGVHLGGQDSLDISADLMELGRTPMAVVCGGCKSYLDTVRSLEFLETQGAVVATFADGRDGNVDFPGFLTRNSGVKSPKVFRDPKEAAAITFSLAKLGTRGNRYTRPGSLFANPISETLSIPKDEIDEAFKQASSEATHQGISGNEITPFILARVRDITEGRSLLASRAVLESNVVMASKIAVHLASLWETEDHTIKQNESLDIGKSFLARRNLTVSFAQPRESKEPKTFVKKEDPSANETKTPKLRIKKHWVNHSKVLGEAKVEASTANDILRPNARPEYSPDIAVIGTVAIELTCNLVLSPNAGFNVDLKPNLNSSNISRIEQNIGGVSHNVALAAHLVSGNQRVRLCSLVADDSSGSIIMRSLKTETLDLSGVKILPRVVDRSGIAVPNRTAQYVAVNDGKKDLVLGMADMQIFRHNSYDCSNLTLKKLKWVIIDANWTRKVVRGLMSMFRTNYPSVKIAFEPTSEQRGADIFHTSANPGEDGGEISNALNVFPNHKIDLVTPDIAQLDQMFCAANTNGYFENNDHWHVLDAFGIHGTQSRDRYRAIAGEELTEKGVPFQTIYLLPYMPTILTKLSSNDVLLTELLKIGDPRLEDTKHEQWIISRTRNSHMFIGGVYMRLFKAAETVDPADIVNSRGVGETLLGILVAGLSRGLVIDQHLIDIAQKGANMTLKCKHPVSPSLGELTQSLDRLALNSTKIGGQHDPITSPHKQEFFKLLDPHDVTDTPVPSSVRFVRNLNFEAEKRGTDYSIHDEHPLPMIYGLPPNKE
ncbi:Pseudouridine-metabolizing bifunctional protein [Golovinomyces cichoracearum]|uniref:Pseudouridine-metabolizing bifunctional protein n=1 Tax=Golovinomyces cichoracearum TaxID=62708 RepID=A0A420IR78_9PEZI|nr:Pseudouridine-metabolizing bifunctional protein [Golovinomyces cichoracearum]